jgi:hypothetical protein
MLCRANPAINPTKMPVIRYGKPALNFSMCQKYGFWLTKQNGGANGSFATPEI